jgi:hypothetical protein
MKEIKKKIKSPLFYYAKKLEKHKNDHSRLLAEQKLMKQHPHLVDRDKPKKKIGIGQVSKGSAVRSEFNIFCTLVTMATAAILDFLDHIISCYCSAPGVELLTSEL